MIAFAPSDFRWAIHAPAGLPSFSAVEPAAAVGSPPQRLRPLCISSSAGGRTSPKPSVCTADELHYVPLPNNEWKLALWRYLPSPQVLYIEIELYNMLIDNPKKYYYTLLYIYIKLGKHRSPLIIF